MKPMKPSDVIKAAYRLIEKPENWAQRMLYGTRDGHRCYCALGALSHVSCETPGFLTAVNTLHDDALEHGHASIEQANDSSTHEGVLRAFRRVYRKLKVEGR